MKNLLLLLDTDPQPSAFDQIVAYDAGADAVLAYGGITPENCFALVEGAIYTRAPKDKKHTAICIGGSDLAAAEAVFEAVRGQFFNQFRVSAMLDANGCNTTAAAAVATMEAAVSLKEATACVLAGTGPVGIRASAMLALAGAEVRLTSRKLDRAQAACAAIAARYDCTVAPLAVADEAATASAIDGATHVLACGQTGIELLPQSVWTNAPSLKVAADVGTCPPLGVAGLQLADSGRTEAGVQLFGGLTIGALKLRTQRAAIASLFESNEQVLDAEEILALARSLR